MTARLGLTMGDPAGIGPEIMLAAARDPGAARRRRRVRADCHRYAALLRGDRAAASASPPRSSKADGAIAWPRVPVIEAAADRGRDRAGQAQRRGGPPRLRRDRARGGAGARRRDRCRRNRADQQGGVAPGGLHLSGPHRDPGRAHRQQRQLHDAGARPPAGQPRFDPRGARRRARRGHARAPALRHRPDASRRCAISASSGRGSACARSTRMPARAACSAARTST